MLLILKTLTRRVVLSVVVLLVWAPVAQAWSWPVAGPVLRPFSYDEAHPYVAGQHRGIDIGAAAVGETVVAPAGGTISFAGTVPTNGKSVTIETADGYAVTLTHLGSMAVVKGATIAEGDPVGAVGSSGAPEVDGPYVHLGIRVATDQNGYVDPLGLLPAIPDAGPTDSGSGASQPGSSGTTSTVSTSESGPSVAAGSGVASTRGSTRSHTRKPGSSEEHKRAQESRADAPARPASHRPAVADAHTSGQTATSRTRVSKPMSSLRRPVVEPAAPHESTGLDVGHEIPSSATAAPSSRPSAVPSSPLLSLLCNGIAALVALSAALAAGRRRRRCLETSPLAVVQVLHQPQPQLEHRRAA